MDYKLDRISYEAGMINCFIEMVACGVKPLAISPPIEPENLALIEEISKELSEGFGTKWLTVQSLMITDIQSAEFTKGKHSVLYYKDDAVIERYMELSALVDSLSEKGEYSGKRRTDISIEFGRMLGYPDNVIFEKIENVGNMDPVTL